MNRFLRFLNQTDLGRAYRLAIISGIVYVLVVLFGKLFWNFGHWMLDLLLCGGGLILWTIFFAQFVLPVRRTIDRLRAAYHLFLYSLQQHGPAVSIRDGVVVQRREENSLRGPGVIFLDAASAAYLRLPGRFTRAIGPGVHFTEDRETIGGAIDLHPRYQSIGPLPKDDPFSEKTNLSAEAAAAQMQRRRETQALTGDNILVTATIEVTFRLDDSDDTLQSSCDCFPYNENAVKNAVAGRYVEITSDKSKSLTEWDQLPTRLAADIWREIIGEVKLDDLFNTDQEFARKATGTTGKTDRTEPEEFRGLDLIRERIKNRLMMPMYETTTDRGKSARYRFRRSHEYEMIKARGLKVLDVRITNLRFPTEVEDQLVKQWRASWLDLAKREQGQVEKLRDFLQTEAQKRSIRDFATASSYWFVNSMAGEPTGEFILAQLLRGVIQGIESDADWAQEAKGHKMDLSELASWVYTPGQSPSALKPENPSDEGRVNL
ncbi:MAG TPA: SPFH domain-containing protein [Anaerolineaceae bacterium]